MKHNAVINIMIKRNLIPELGMFNVDEQLLEEFYSIYNEIFGNAESKMRTSNVRYAKKLAGINLMKLNIDRATNVNDLVLKVKVTKPKCGIVYLVSNPAWPGMYKVGITRDLSKRLSQYQTGDPHRSYKVEHYKFVEDIRKEESRILELMQMDLVKGEWVSSEKVKLLFNIKLN